MLSKSVDNLRNSVASSPTFQAWTGTDNEAAAKLRVHAFGLDDPDAAAKPFCVVDWAAGGFSREVIAGGIHSQSMGSGVLHLIFHAAITVATQIDEEYEFANEVGRIIEDLELVAGTACHLDIKRITLVQGPFRPDEDESQTRGDYYEAVFEIGFDSL